MGAVHSQQERVPTCPNNWESMYEGYSFIMNTGRGQGGCGQPLDSAGSCLEHFRQTPFVQVNSRGECEFHPTSHSFWLTTSTNRNDFDAPSSNTTATRTANVGFDRRQHHHSRND